MRRLDRELIAAYKRMSDLTAPRCGVTKTCKTLADSRCCNKMHCDIATDWVNEFWGGGSYQYVVDIEDRVDPQVKFLKKGHGCVLPPHMRPMCTLHDCEVYVFGGMKDPCYDRDYFKLREFIDALEHARSSADDAWKEAWYSHRMRARFGVAYARQYADIQRHLDPYTRRGGIQNLIQRYVQEELDTDYRVYAKPSALGVRAHRLGARVRTKPGAAGTE